jgi:hypothetical protein
MSAIITSKFRLDTTNKFVASLADNQFYMALGRPNAWADDTTPTVPYENDYTSHTLWENMFAMKRVDAIDIIHSSTRNLWVSGTTYIEYDDQDTNIEGKLYFVISDNNNVYLCLKAGNGSSSVNPDVIGVQAAGVHVTGADGYVWKYMYTIPTADVTKFLTSSFIPVRHLLEAPGAGADTALTNQWNVQEAAVDGAIYNYKITNAGVDYTSVPTLTVVGDGTSATATAVLSGGTTGTMTDITVDVPGTGYTHALITVTTSGSTTSAVVRPVIGPVGGFGANPTSDLRSHYVTINKAFTGDESASIPDANDFRQIAILKNPTTLAASSAAISGASSMVIGQFYKILTLGNSSAANWATAGAPADYKVGTVFKAIAVTSTGTGTVGAIASATAYNTCSSLTVATGNTFPSDQLIEGTITGAKAFVVEYNATSGVIHYIQNEATGYVAFTDSDYIRESGTSIAGKDCTAVTGPLINHHSGDVMFVENKTATSRATDQVETVRLVIAF